MRHRKALVAVVLATLVVLAGCSGGADGGAPEGEAAERAGDDAPGGDGGDGADGGGSDSAGSGGGGDRANADTDGFGGAVEDAAIIRTGTVALTVPDYRTARATLSAAVRDRGGYVSDATQQLHRDGNRTWTTGTVTFRVPAGSFEGFLERAKAVGEVRSSSVESRDVSDRLLDIEARLATLRSQRDRLRTLYDEANTTDEVLRVGERLSAVQTDIERLEAKQRSLEERVALSTLTVELDEPEPPAPEPVEPDRERWYDVGVVSAFLDSVDGVVVTLRAVGVGVAYAAPYLLAFGLPVVGVAWVAVRRYR